MLSLSDDCVVLGPSDDGGYYLIGLKKLYREMFEGINWSTGTVLEETIRKARALNLPVHLLPRSYDVDDSTTLGRLCRDLLGSNERGETAMGANETRNFLREIIGREGRDRIWRL